MMKALMAGLIGSAVVVAAAPDRGRWELGVGGWGSLMSEQPAANPTSIERLDPALDTLIAPDAKIEVLAEGHDWTEGPVWVKDGVDRARKVFDALAAGGQVRMPFAPPFWGGHFGMLVDKFGVPWMVSCE